MAIDEADQSDVGGYSDGDTSATASDEERVHEPTRGSDVRVGEYTWADFLDEHGYGDEVSTLYPHGTTLPDDQLKLETGEDEKPVVPHGSDWDRVSFDPEDVLGFHPDDLPDLIGEIAQPSADVLTDLFLEYVDPETTPVVKDVWSWEHYKWEYYYEDDGSRPRTSNGEIDRFDGEEALGFDPDDIEEKLFQADSVALTIDDLVDERTVNVQDDIDEDEFFSNDDGTTTVTNRYDLEKAVPLEKKKHFREVERYWVNKPYAFVVVFHSEKENEKKYYVIEPYLNEIESDLQEFLTGKLRTAIKYSDEGIKQKETEEGRQEVIEDETRRLLKRYDLFEKTADDADVGILETIKSLLNDDEDAAHESLEARELEGIEVRPEPVILAEDPDTLNEYQVEKLLYLLKRNFIGYERIDAIKHDINVEDISCDGYDSPVFVYHSEYEQIISNIHHGTDELDDFVVKLAQRSGKGISKRLPQVDATLPDGSRAQLTLGKEVSDHGTNYTIRQFKDVPFTPIDLINWNTFSLDEMAFLWLAIENHKSLIFAGGTASGKTTSLNAVSLFIPSNAKIVSIEDTREVELPQRNWIASVTRPSFSDDAQGDVDEFDLLEAALRQRPDYIVMGEIRGEEGRTLFQVMSTGHTTYTTFHADSVDEVLKRFTTDPINVSKTMFTALDLVSIQTQTRVQGRKVRRNKSLTEINHYEAEHDEINVQDVYQWQAETDEYLKMGDSNTLEEIRFDRGWTAEKLEEELFKRQVILAYLIKNGLNTYAEVAATVQAFINDPDTILTLIANGQLEESLEDLRKMESVLIDVDPEKEELVPRPAATNETYNLSMDILERAEESLFEEYRGRSPSGLSSALGGIDQADPIEVDADADEFDLGGVADDAMDDDWGFGSADDEFGFGDAEGAEAEAPSWLSDDSGFDFGPDEGTTGSDAAEAAGPGAEAAGSTAADASATPEGERDSDLPALVGDADAEAPTRTESQPTTPGPESDTDESAPNPIDSSTPKSDPSAHEPPTDDTHELPTDDTHEPPTDDTHEPPTDESVHDDVDERSGDADAAPAGAAQEGGDEDIGGLFDDMERTLEGLEATDRSAASEADGADADRTDDGSEANVDTSQFDAMFPERDLDSIFGSRSTRSSAEPPGRSPENIDEFVYEDDGVGTDDSLEEGDDGTGNDGSPFGNSGSSIFSDEESDGKTDRSPFGGDDDADRGGENSIFSPADEASDSSGSTGGPFDETDSERGDGETDDPSERTDNGEEDE
ncbi:ATPase, T2SS/T4P/T4SS family [Natrialbaceae archaeon GCM10025810]|uniref:ATPase, T2SS/T4P/T4SS family n=1 Tax=Halovalidus salilacus TaxID=3075124 RepID=UPI00360F548A